MPESHKRMLSFPARGRLRLLVWTAGLVSFLAGSTRAGAQIPVTMDAPHLDTALALQVDSLFHEGKHQESLTLLDQRLEEEPGDYLSQVLAARTALVLGYASAYKGKPDAKDWLHRAIGYADKAVAILPEGVDGRYVRFAAQGQLALSEGPITRAHLGVVVDSAARHLLADDSLYPGAHNALGRTYFIIASLSWFERLFARHWLGGDLMSRATWQAAEEHLRRAVELQPERNFNYLDLGTLLVKRGRLDEARTILEEGLKVPLEVPEQEYFRDDMRKLLDEIRKRTGDAG